MSAEGVEVLQDEVEEEGLTHALRVIEQKLERLSGSTVMASFANKQEQVLLAESLSHLRALIRRA